MPRCRLVEVKAIGRALVESPANKVMVTVGVTPWKMRTGPRLWRIRKTGRMTKNRTRPLLRTIKAHPFRVLMTILVLTRVDSRVEKVRTLIGKT